MKCALLQPSYIPWRGYFHQVQKVETFVFYDDVPFDQRGWRARNRIKTHQGRRWLSIPVHSKGSVAHKTPIRDMTINWSRRWNQTHMRSLRQSYGNEPYWPDYEELLASFYQRRDRWLADFVIELTVALCGVLGLHRDFLRSSELDVPVGSGRSERVLAIVQRVGADCLVCGPAAASYLDTASFDDAGVRIEYMHYDYPEYPQPYPPYDPRVSILDLLFAVGSDAGRYIWGDDF